MLFFQGERFGALGATVEAGAIALCSSLESDSGAGDGAEWVSTGFRYGTTPAEGVSSSDAFAIKPTSELGSTNTSMASEPKDVGFIPTP